MLLHYFGKLKFKYVENYKRYDLGLKIASYLMKNEKFLVILLNGC